jgi:hypothetical protein
MNHLNTRQFKRRSKAECFEQGRLFEEYVKNLFNQDSFKIKKWRKSILLPSNTYIAGLGDPDFELIFVGKNQYTFAVECKWKSDFNKGKTKWAEQDQIERYLDFERKRTMPVFIAMGIGGLGNKPENMFVTPLCNIIADPKVYEHQLISYRRKPTRRFFYDTIQGKLF